MWKTLAGVWSDHNRMNDTLSIKQAVALNDSEIMVALSDDRSVLLTVEQLLTANPEVIPEPDHYEEDSN